MTACKHSVSGVRWAENVVPVEEHSQHTDEVHPAQAAWAEPSVSMSQR